MLLWQERAFCKKTLTMEQLSGCTRTKTADVPSEEVAKYQAAVQKFFNEQAPKNDQKGVPNINDIVGLDGEPIKS